MCGSCAEQRKTKNRCSLCDVALCQTRDSDGVSCWDAWHAAAEDKLQESSKRRADALKEERFSKRFSKRQRRQHREIRAAEAEAVQGAFFRAGAAGKEGEVGEEDEDIEEGEV